MSDEGIYRCEAENAHGKAKTQCTAHVQMAIGGGEKPKIEEGEPPRFIIPLSDTSVVLGGMVVSSLFQALVSLVKYVADPDEDLPAITYWLMGSMSRATYQGLAVGIPLILLGVALLFLLRWRLNILSLQEDETRALGIDVRKLRIMVMAASTLVTASCVSLCGQVGWVGLLIPHVARMLYGSDNRKIIPVSMGLGSAFMVVIDTASRAATAAEIPVSILTAIIGAPFFIILLRRTGGARL